VRYEEAAVGAPTIAVNTPVPTPPPVQTSTLMASEARYSNFNLKRIHVIQHSTGSTAYNEKFTDSSNLSYLKNKSSYQAIANGNVGGNGTAILNQHSFYLVSTARASRFSAQWNAGFQYLLPYCSVRTKKYKLDFSDTVELMYIINDKNTQNVNDFANKYLN
jgi:hypothetical protein